MSHVKFEDEDPEVIFERKHPRIKRKMKNSFISSAMDVLIEQETDHKFFTSKRKYAIKCVLRILIYWIFNLGPVYISYLLVSLGKLWSFVRKKDQSSTNKRQYLLWFILDFILCMSQACMYLIFVSGILNYDKLNSLQKEYFLWSLNCMLLTLLFVLFMTYNELYLIREHEITQARAEASKDSHHHMKYNFRFQLNDLVGNHNFIALGLGRFQHIFTRSIKKMKKNQAEKDALELKEQVDHIMHMLNLDPTMVYFTIQADKKRKPTENELRMMLSGRNQLLRLPEKSSAESTDLMLHLQRLGFRGSRNIIENFLLPHYLYTRKFCNGDPNTRWVTVMMLLIIKILVPNLHYISQLSHEVVIYSIIFTLFYLQIGSSIYELVINDDLKTKNYIYMALGKVVNINNLKQPTEEEAAAQQPQVNLIEQNQFDLACCMTLQSWDTVRRIALMLEQKKQTHYNFVFMFLALYGKICFIAFILCRLKVDLLGSTYNYCKEDIFLYNIHIDATFVIFVCMLRIYEGSKFQESIAEIKDMCHRLASIYEDLFTLFEFYFADSSADFKSENVIFIVVEMIKVQIQQNIQEDIKRGHFKSEEEDEDHDLNAIAKERAFLKIKELKGTMEKIAKQVARDEKVASLKSIGVFGADFHKFVKVACVVALSYVPSLFKKVSTYINQLA